MVRWRRIDQRSRYADFPVLMRLDHATAVEPAMEPKACLSIESRPLKRKGSHDSLRPRTRL
jgi:hypothetical protein